MEIVIIGVALVAGAALAVPVALLIGWGLYAIAGTVFSALAWPTTFAFSSLSAASRRSTLRQEAEYVLNPAARSRGRKGAMLEAQRQSRVIHAYTGMLAQSASLCVQTHHHQAMVMDAEFMVEAAVSDVSEELRARTNTLVSMVTDSIESYPGKFSSPELLKSLVILRECQNICLERCPYMAMVRPEAS